MYPVEQIGHRVVWVAGPFKLRVCLLQIAEQLFVTGLFQNAKAASLQVCRCFGGRVALSYAVNQYRRAFAVGWGEIKPSESIAGDGQTGGGKVCVALLQNLEQSGKAGGQHQFQLNPEMVSESTCKFILEACGVVATNEVGHRSVGGGNAQNAVFLDRLKLGWRIQPDHCQRKCQADKCTKVDQLAQMG